LVERLVRNEKARGSNPLTSTSFGLFEFLKVGTGVSAANWGCLKA
jgi:hypothetical protein